MDMSGFLEDENLSYVWNIKGVTLCSPANLERSGIAVRCSVFIGDLQYILNEFTIMNVRDKVIWRVKVSMP